MFESHFIAIIIPAIKQSQLSQEKDICETVRFYLIYISFLYHRTFRFADYICKGIEIV